MTEKTAEALVTEVGAAMEQMKANHAEIVSELKEAMESSDKDLKESLAKSEELAKAQIALADQIVEIEQKLADNVHAGKAPIETLGRMIIKSDEFKQFASGNISRLQIEANTIIGQEGSPLENADTLVAPMRVPGIIPGAFRSLRVRDIVPQGSTTSNAVEYTRELAFTNNAAETAEAASKPD